MRRGEFVCFLLPSNSKTLQLEKAENEKLLQISKHQQLVMA